MSNRRPPIGRRAAGALRQSDEHESNGSSASAGPQECSTCRQLRFEGADEHCFVVSPGDGGGWEMWSAALLRLLRRIGHQPTRAIIISQPVVNDRYVQALIGHGVAHVEVGSNVYLTGGSRLSADHEELLSLLGWLRPESDTDASAEMPANWHLRLVDGDWRYVAEMLVSTMVGTLGFVEQLPVQVRSFGADSPCRECSWPHEIATQAS